MATYQQEHKLLYFGAFGTGSTSVIKALTGQLHAVQVPEQDIYDEAGARVCRSKHTTPAELKRTNILDEETYGSCFKFSTVRNPLDFMVSEYLRSKNRWYPKLDDPDFWLSKAAEGKRKSVRISGTASFPEWIEYELGNSKERLLHSKYIEDADFVMYFDTLTDDFAEAMKRAGVRKTVTLPHKNPTKQRETDEGERIDFTTFYDKRSAELVYRAFRSEFEMHNFKLV